MAESSPTTPQRLLAEGIGTLLLLAVVIGSGVMAQRLSGGNDGIALLANTLATVFGLYALIEVLAPVSGAHFNPVVSAVMALRGELPPRLLLPYVLVQLAGAAAGAWLVHAMFDLPLLQWSAKVRSGPPGDDEPDYALEVWAGVIPTALVRGTPVPDPKLAFDVPPPKWTRLPRSVK